MPGGACDGCKKLGPLCCEGAVNRNVALDTSNSGYSGAESLAQLVASVRASRDSLGPRENSTVSQGPFYPLK